ncbi:SpoIIE family protein phosphatase [Cohnella sp. LGH]|uniref:Serine phosphatase RsbU (Regulator of sigma subunit) n=1 Tax=Cohnella phaseoli TaxID=456490 RepID=A0A3D9JSY1_9BACL|nr:MULTISPECIES: GAF domain-containing SpoIIE family protein phosphatase [Cohnella]QTH40312.1 SpoIIE family protein phosphatase [Cohnella sp. LGH]RED76657.1 serine phosphatase RsbU (regulator of sigma subunit) [Cohnella phaseoli]
MDGQWVAAGIGALAGAAVGAGAVYALVRMRLRRMKALLEISMQLNSTLKRGEQMELIMNTAKRVLPVEAASVLLLDPETDELFFELAQGEKGAQVREIRLKPGEGIAGHVAQSGHSLIVNDTGNDPRWSNRVAEKTGFETRNLLTVPIVNRNKVEGVLQVINKKGGKFTVRDRMLLEQVSRPMAVALENARLYAQVEESLAELRSTTAIKERLESELQVAGTIQMSFLPRTMPSAYEPYDVCALLKSAKEVGGDFYNFFKIDDDHLFFALGDVSDKGIPAALFMAVTLTLLKGKMGPGQSPGELLTAVNDELARDNPLVFATIVCGVYTCSTGELVMSEGGHCTPYVVRANGSIEPVKLKKSLPLAAMEDAVYHDAKLSLEPGDRLLLYTDGITEAENAAQEQYSSDRLREFLGMTSGMSSAETIDALLMHVFMFADGAPQSDDIAVLTLMRR